MKSISLLLLGMCLVAMPLTAQDTTHARHPGQRPRAAMGQRGRMQGGGGATDEMMPMLREMMAPLMRVIAYTPEHLLEHKDSLQLTADQVTKLTAIQNSAKAAHDSAANDVKTHLGAVNQVFQSASPDTSALRTHFEEAHSAMGKAHWVMLSAAAQSRALLTDAQRAKVDARLSMMEQRRGT